MLAIIHSRAFSFPYAIFEKKKKREKVKSSLYAAGVQEKDMSMRSKETWSFWIDVCAHVHVSTHIVNNGTSVNFDQEYVDIILAIVSILL